MKKIISIMLCLGIITPVFSQKALVDQAKKLSGKTDKLEEARSLIKQAIENPETQNNAETYFIAGKIELDAFDNAYKTRMINPDDPSAKGGVMADEIIAAYKYFLKALNLDSIPNEKGQINTKQIKEIKSKIRAHAGDIFTAGADYYNEKSFYPQAYEAFMIYGNLPEGVLSEYEKDFNPQQLATAFYNAGLAASQGNATELSAEAFQKARLGGYSQPEAYIYEIACWQTIAQQDNERASEAQSHIKAVAQAGIDEFGIENAIFINNLINAMVSDNEAEKAIATLNQLISANPDAANLYGLRGYVYDRMDNYDLSEADYRKAASMPSVDFETLKNASNQLYRIGSRKNNEIEGNSDEANAARQNIKENYFLAAKQIAEQAQQMDADDPYIKSILENIDYALTTFFN